jgi:hypothetical protein
VAARPLLRPLAAPSVADAAVAACPSACHPVWGVQLCASALPLLVLLRLCSVLLVLVLRVSKLCASAPLCCSVLLHLVIPFGPR